MFEDRLEGALGSARALADLAAETENEVRQLGCPSSAGHGFPICKTIAPEA